jgi:hypothetical protein
MLKIFVAHGSAVAAVFSTEQALSNRGQISSFWTALGGGAG